MADDSDLRRDLVGRIEARRAAVQAFLRAHRPRTRRRANVIIICSSLSALFTAGPAFGGERFTDTVQDMLDLESGAYVWQFLCLFALLVSVAGAVLTNISKSQDDINRLSMAEAANAELEGLSTLLQFGHLTMDDGVKLYHQYSVKIPFVEELPPRVRAGYGPPPRR